MSKRCCGCMKIKQNSPICEHCGYNENVPNYPNQLPVGTVLRGQYTVGKVLGQGGFGITYIGWDHSLEMAVAIKEFYPRGVVNRDSQYTQMVSCNGEEAEIAFHRNKERFLKEAKILAKLQNIPGIVRVQNLFSENNTVYIVMEYVKGIDLKHYIRMKNRSLSVEETFSVMRPIINAMHKVHEAELVHRDISPDNIMILHDGTVKLLDFGAARVVEHAQVGEELPESTEAILKHGFAPIEQYSRRGNLGPWTDVYALCATIYYCLTGRIPNAASDRIMGDDNVNWRSIPGLTEGQIKTLEKGLAMLPENRLQTMEQLYRGLYEQECTVAKPTRVQEKTVKAEEKPEKAQKKPAPPVETKKQKTTPMIAAVLAMVAVVAAAGWLLKGPGEEPAMMAASQTETALTAEAEKAAEPTETAPPSGEELAYGEAEALAEAGEHAKAGLVFGKLGDYKDARERSLEEWGYARPKQTISFGSSFYSNYGIPYLMGLREDGTAVLTGPNYNQCQSVSGWTDLVGVCMAGESVPLGIKADGTVVFGQPIILVEHFFDYDMEYFGEQIKDWTDVVYLYPNGGGVYALNRDGTMAYACFSKNVEDIRETNARLSEWTDIVDMHSSIILRSDGTVQSDNPSLQTWENVISLSGDSGKVFGICADGTVYVAERKYDNDSHEWIWSSKKVEGLTDVIAVCNMVALKSDGTVSILPADNESTESSEWLDKWKDTILEWEDIKSLYYSHSCLCGVKEDGTVVVAGQGYTAETIRKWTDIACIIRTYDGIMGIKKDGSIVMCGKKNTEAKQWTNIQIP